MGTLLAIYIAPAKAAELQNVPQARAVPGSGIEGDRYFRGEGTSTKPGNPSTEVTLIETESLEALERDYSISLSPAATRRNLLTSGVALNHLVGRDFQVGEVTLRGLRLCEPCGHLEKLTQKDVEKGLLHRGGLRAQVLTAGMLRAGDEIRTRQES
ncbi:MAG TPA: MOSC domain-containing protein [Bryobacterales bacterium]|nr:MOSC domain-containing protein [Bryobacterales bacterium]